MYKYHHFPIILTNALFIFAMVFTNLAIAQKAEDKKRITILHTNDSHGRITPFKVGPGSATSQTGDTGGQPQEFSSHGTVGGFAYQAAKIKEIYASSNFEPLLIHAGDTFSDDLLGNITQGRATIELMNEVGYDFVALGNHDFDYGFEQTQKLQSLADFPMRAANAIRRDTGKPVFGKPYKIFEIASTKVGVLSLAYHHTPFTGNRKNITPLHYFSGITAGFQWIPKLRKQVDILVVVSHLGTAVDKKLASKVDGIDVIIGGHSHNWIEPLERINDTWIVESLSNGVLLGEVTIDIQDGKIEQVSGQQHTLWDNTLDPDSKIALKIKKLRHPHKDQLEEPIGTLSGDIGRNYKSESPFDKLTGQIMIDKTGAEVAFLPGIGYGVTLKKGPVTREQLYTLIPHPSKMVILELTGNQILGILEQSARNQKPSDPEYVVGGLVQTAGMQWTVDYQQSAENRISEISIGENQLRPDQLYSVVTHSGMLAGTHRYTNFAKGKNIEVTDLQINDIVEDFFNSQDIIHPPETGDVTIIPAK